MAPKSSDVSTAITLYLGFETEPFPKRNSESLIQAFGKEHGKELEAIVIQTLGELNKISVDWSFHTLQSGGDVADTEMKSRHPELSESAIKALAWKFSFDWK